MLVTPSTCQPWVRLPRGRVSRLPFRLLSLPPQQRIASIGAKYQTMFRKAVESHSTASAKEQAYPRPSLPSSSPPSQDVKIHQLLSSDSNKRRVMSSAPLQRTSHSTLNALDKRPLGAKPAVKRTASGLAKSLHGSQDPFIEMEKTDAAFAASAALGNQTSSLSFFDENDFDSDLDLEVEELSTKRSFVSKKQPSPKLSAKKSVTYQSQQKANLHSQVDNTSHVFENSQANDSSLPLPWSSSPASHKEPPRPSDEAQRVQPTAQQSLSFPEAVESDSRPTKRRTLPWLAEEAQQAKELENKKQQFHPSSNPRGNSGTTATPASKSSNGQLYPWNTTASAIKAQQKQHRKDTKKPASKVQDEADTGQVTSIANAKRKAVSRPHLSVEQRRVLELVTEQGKSVFFTGSAGTGKSVLLREIIAVLRKKYQRETDRVAITASTGLAACNIGGVTLHSFSGIGLGKEPVPELVKKIKRNQKAKHRWMRTKVLIIDEISMVDAELFDKLEEIARSMRGNGRPFGGIQLIITGDFFQLPPVPEQGARVSKFAFDALTWPNSIDHTIALHHVFRQKDPKFANMLNEMREGYLSPESDRAFRGLSRDIDYGDSLMATELFPRRNEVDAANLARMRQLVGTSQIFEARDGGTIVDKANRDKLLSNCMAPAVIELKKGAQVMLIKNTDETLVNGTLGHVIGFMNEATFDSYNADEDAYHAIQNAKDDDLNPHELKQKRQMQLTATTGQVYPLVRFSISDGTTRDVLCTRESWKIELPNGEVQASRSQIPLILAWALSIHKAQGQTLERVKVDLRNVFEKGQAYVALSRATSMKGLQVLSFDPAKVMAHGRVREFYSSLARAESIGDEDLKIDAEDAANKNKKKKAGNIMGYS